MDSVFGSDPLLFPTLGPATLDLVRTLYGALLLATLVAALPHARRYFLSERWGGYGARGWWVDLMQNPIVVPLVLATWLAAGVGLLADRERRDAVADYLRRFGGPSVTDVGCADIATTDR